MNIPCLLLQCLGGGGTFVGDPCIPHRTFCVVLGVLQLAEVMFNLLRGMRLTIATLQPVQQNRDVIGLPTPVTLGTDGAKHAGELSGNPPGTQVGNCQHLVSGGLGSEQPHPFTWLDGVLLISVPAAAALESSGKLNLNRTVGAKLMVLESTYVCVGG